MNYTTKASRAKITREAKSKRTVYSAVICFLYNYSWTEYATVCGHFYNANGDVIFSENPPYLEFQRLVPGSNGHMWADAAQYTFSAKKKPAPTNKPTSILILNLSFPTSNFSFLFCFYLWFWMKICYFVGWNCRNFSYRWTINLFFLSCCAWAQCCILLGMRKCRFPRKRI